MSLLNLYVIAFIMSFVIAYCMTPVSKKIAFKVGAVAQPRKRDMHSEPIPRMGGIAIVSGVMITLLLLYPNITTLDTTQTFGIIAGGLIIFILGVCDDIFELGSKLKLTIQIIASLVVALSGVQIEFIGIPFFDEIGLLDTLTVPVTVIWIVGVTNAVNLIDGLDGLAAGVSSIASICLMILSINSGYPIAVFLTATLAGACLGFLPYNFNPASIFMGDTGSTFLGFMLAVTSILGLLKTYTLGTIFVAILILGLPIFDTAFAIIRRFLAGKPIMSPDRGHLHHRLVDRGYTHKHAVVTLYGVSGIFGLSAIAFVKHDIRFVIAVFILMGILLYFNTKIMTPVNQDNNSSDSN
ncbi:MAG: undecaprenyl-phosphate alpha-N-acetylglucosaminyl 1-phosphate transferase [Epulopiscium sp. Nele67-Bin005]|nr:MAG: undecaprenyl-phosphate alpha-N-acetylglucosaminyl 1-phosphate transferase [Epulopiscium sp. Nele67-Bin005]